ncbi:entry exclusion lipoprotein TrbK [Pseudoduganella sp. SL102]|uniref:entry exclusion lipoprotein TrbK n=1 Tax=Pseudoduganella sp. SL102 TaxID=2995154 RepID=UPI00248D2021|nr:entry exclusion lipoprotein TrbK [Pseudoduganella sp. SL102]WBS05499.1 entry exclusion lipoprotein TrbK [Pseudoduganella sp. SL102]
MENVKPASGLSPLAPGLSLGLALSLSLLLAGCGKVDPQLTAQQMTMTDATCAPAEVSKIADTDVRKAFQERCDRREQFKPAAPPAG